MKIPATRTRRIIRPHCPIPNFHRIDLVLKISSSFCISSGDSSFFITSHNSLPPRTPSLCLSLLRCTSGLQNLERAHQSIIHSHHCTCIVKLSTIVGSGKYSYQFTIGKEFISVFDDLMGSHNEVEVVTVEEFMDDIYAECE